MPRGPNKNTEPMQHSWEADRAAGGGNAAPGLVKGPRHVLFLPSPVGAPATEMESGSKTIAPVGLGNCVHMVLPLGTLICQWRGSPLLALFIIYNHSLLKKTL